MVYHFSCPMLVAYKNVYDKSVYFIKGNVRNRKIQQQKSIYQATAFKYRRQKALEDVVEIKGNKG